MTKYIKKDDNENEIKNGEKYYTVGFHPRSNTFYITSYICGKDDLDDLGFNESGNIFKHREDAEKVSNILQGLSNALFKFD